MSTKSGVLSVCILLAPIAGGTMVHGCARPDGAAVRIVTSGPHSVQQGAVISISAETLHGTDHDYTWSSTNELVATVSADGTVTGVAPGEVLIIADGDDTKAAGEHVVVVLASTGDTTGDETSSGGSEGEGSGTTGAPEVPYYDQWLMSAHADATAEAFNHWNAEGEIPTSCARCHSQQGFRDYLGDDRSEVGVVNQPAPTGSVVDCETCHNPAAAELDWVTFPSGVTVDELGAEARCMTCHQGRASTDDVDEAIMAAGVGDDEVSDQLTFENIHYFPTAATLFAGVARGGYQYEDQVYDHRFRHVPEFDSCVGCHDPHDTKPRFDECTSCHSEAVDAVGARDIRMIASRNVDYDGDGDTSVGLYYEVEGLKENLYRAIQRYGSGVVGEAMCYAPDAYPYWFVSATGANEECTADEAVPDNGYSSWTPRLVRAAYNFQMARKDPGAYVHNGRYIIKLLYDAIVDLNEVIAPPIDMSAADRDAPGHFNGASEAARHWDEDEVVSASCSKCHSGAPGFRFWIQYGVGEEVPETANGLECYTCHENFGATYDVLQVDATTYTNGTVLEHDGYDNICATCHSGRTSGAEIDSAIGAGQYGFRNVHYLPAAGVRNGNLSAIGYEYPGMTYAGFLQHDSRTQCAGCHDPVASNHTFEIADVWDTICTVCHNDDAGPQEIRTVHLDDYDGDANIGESLGGELQGLADQLLLAIVGAAGSPICYAEGYPYWLDTAGDAQGNCAPDAMAGGFSGWTPELMRAAHNFQLHRNDPGAYAHNFDYMGQLLYDSIADLGGDVVALVRP